jgi:hypothetical protein
MMSAEELSRLVDEAGFVFRGQAVPRGPTSVEIGPAAAGKTVTVEVQEVVGSDVTVVSEDAAAIAEAGALVFFTNCVSLGDQVLVREVAHRAASDESVSEIEEALRAAAERPLGLRVASADLIVTGEVASSRALEQPFPPTSEHDPEWWIARVNVESAIKGRKPRTAIEVLFANSMDIVWYRSPKLHEGASGIFILQATKEDEAPPDVPRTVYQVTDPLDFLPAERLPDVQRLLDEYTVDR